MMRLTRRALLFASGSVVGGLAVRGLAPHSPSLAGIAPVAAQAGTLNDASLLSETPVFRHIVIRDDPGEALVAALRAELKQAATSGRAVNIGAARHSMGGQAIPRHGHAITCESAFIEPDTAAGTYRVQAGVRWGAVIARLDPLGFSPKVMQSNNDFGIASTFSVNAHGWPVPHGPMGSTVRSVMMLLPDGSHVRASRTENAGLFRAAMGGYGLIGLITELEVEMVPNQRLAPRFTELPAAQFAQSYVQAMADPAITMAYGRLNVDRARFFQDALLVTYSAVADQSALPPATGSGLVSHVSRQIFRAQLGNERVKTWRWYVETDIGPAIGGDSTRNALINEPVITLDDRDPRRTDILHEYFVAPEAFPAFLTACAEVIPNSYQELLNVTLRYVAADPDSLLAYAPTPRIAAVMLFSQEITGRGEADMARMTRELIGQVLAIGGSYYLPYRLHATHDQLIRAYPLLPDFIRAKQAVDPAGILRNALWDTYLRTL